MWGTGDRPVNSRVKGLECTGFDGNELCEVSVDVPVLIVAGATSETKCGGGEGGDGV